MNPYHPDIVGTCAACAFFYEPNGCDLHRTAVNPNQPMCKNGDARASPTWYGTDGGHNSIEDDTDAFRRADQD